VYNTGAYDCLQSLELLDGLIDIYMPDFKFWNDETAFRLCRARDYPKVARDAIKEMHRQVGFLRFDSNGMAQTGVLVRHLAMPGLQQESVEIMNWISNEIATDTFVHIMEQYTPAHNVGKLDKTRVGTEHVRYEEINKPVTQTDIDFIKSKARESGLWRFYEDSWDRRDRIKTA